MTYPIGSACLPRGFELNSLSVHNIRRVYRHHHDFYEREHAKIKDNLLRWKNEEKVQKSEAG
ncbi:MAG TPA: hypothetical protein PLR57_07385, partial [Clostridia bacterium]|nr:hypothetical protein [Clostridia bacterium]